MAFWNRKKKEDDGEYITIRVKKRNILPPHYIALYEKLYDKFDADEYLEEACYYGIQYGMVEYPKKTAADLKEIDAYGEQIPKREAAADKMKKMLDDEVLSTAKQEGRRMSRRLRENEARIYVGPTYQAFVLPLVLTRRLVSEGWQYYCFIFNMKERQAFLALSKHESCVARRIYIDRGRGRMRFGLLASEIGRLRTCLGMTLREGEGNYIHTTAPKVDNNGLLRIYIHK